MHDLYRDWLTATLSEVGRRYGHEALEALMTEPAEELGTGYCRLYIDKDPKDIPEKHYTRPGLTKPA